MKNIFISSTFIDMQAERDLVQERVLPALRDEARKYGDNVGVIDLRWGVDTSTLETEDGAAKVLKVCLDEIDRSHPYMLIFLGERYGTMMREDQIEKSVRGREDKYTTDDYVKSITALEVEYGALSEKYGELNHCVVCFREPVVHKLDGAEKELYAEHTEEGKRKLEALKERIKRDLGDDDRLITYSCSWDKSARQLVDFASNGQPLENVLTNCFAEMFRDDWKEYENLSWQDKEQLAFRALMESKLRSFVGREALLEEYYQSAVNGTCPIILQGEVGSGKTAITCKLVERLKKEGKNVFAFFSGAGSMSTNAESLVKQMVYYMENLLGAEVHFGEKEAEKDETDDVTEKLLRAGEKRVQYDDWMEQLGELCFRLPEGEKVYFCIDAMDQLFRDEHLERLDFFIRRKNVQVVASCTDEFELPMEAIVKREVKQIPALSEEDAKTVAEGILASYSRNAYAAIEAEILKKKSIGNPLYISLLIQRLNMMDTEELRKAMNEEEIVALGTGIIREMPEETEEAIVSVIRDGIEKISEEHEVLFEILQYLAISRNGLRMSDLQGIFAAKGRTMPILDLTLLMKYLDSFFYVHEDDRIDFTHKVIRQGLLKGLTDREAKEVTIKEYLKSLDEADGLRIREGMYFARICKDEEFASKLIGLAYNSKNEELVKEITNEAVADEGTFYCRLIEKENGETSTIRAFFLWRLPEQLGLAKEEMRAKLTIGEAVVACMESLHENNESEGSLRELSISYKNMGNVLKELGRSREALVYFEKYQRCCKELCMKSRSELNLRELSISFVMIGRVLRSLKEWKEERQSYVKALRCAEELHEIRGNESSLPELFIIYNIVGDALYGLSNFREARVYYEKALWCVEELHEKFRSERILQDLSFSYNKMGDVLRYLGQAREALSYYEKALKCAEEMYEKHESERSLRELSGCYIMVGQQLKELNQKGEALSYYKKGLRCIEELHEKSRSESSLRHLLRRYKLMGMTLENLGQERDGVLYYEKALKCEEELYEKIGSELSLSELLSSYRLIGHALYRFGRLQEARLYYEKALKCTEILYEKDVSELIEGDWLDDYFFMSIVLCELKQYEEALGFSVKLLNAREEKYRLREDFYNLCRLLTAYNNNGWILCEFRKFEEALECFEKALRLEEKSHGKVSKKDYLPLIVETRKNYTKALLATNRITEALDCGRRAVELNRDIYLRDDAEHVKESVMESLSIYAETLLADDQLNEAYMIYTEALEHCKSVCEKNDSVRNTRIYVKVLNGLYLSLCKLGQIAEAKEYFLLAKEEAKKLYERTGLEKDRVLLEEVLSIKG